MESKVKVYGKAQNRTALGIMNAYLKIYPDATLQDLRNAFPNSLNPDKGAKENFIPAAQAPHYVKWDHYFDHPDELLTLANGEKVAVTNMWTHASYDRLVQRAKEYGIVVADFSKTDRGVKGNYELEYLNGFTPAKSAMLEIGAAKAEAELPAPGQETKDANEPELELPAAEATNTVAAAAATVASAATAATASAANAAKAATSTVTTAAADTAKAATDTVKDAAANIPPITNLDAPVGKSGIAWLWWLLALIFLAIIILCCVRGCDRHECDGSSCTKEAAAFVSEAKTDVQAAHAAATKAMVKVAATAKPVKVVAVSADQLAKLAQYQKAFNEVEFNNGNAAINNRGRKALNDIVSMLKADPNLRLQAIGHASADGSEQANLKMSERRAQNVVEYLESQGIPANRLSYVGWGEKNQVDPEHPYAIDNRCVTFNLSK